MVMLIMQASWSLLSFPGVDALNTVLEVVLFAAVMNLGQGWKTVLTLFGCRFTCNSA